MEYCISKAEQQLSKDNVKLSVGIMDAYYKSILIKCKCENIQKNV